MFEGSEGQPVYMIQTMERETGKDSVSFPVIGLGVPILNNYYTVVV